MCLIVFAFNHHPDYPIILAGNRDEFYARKAQQAHFWNTDPEILAGKDLRAGGTWLGVSKNGAFSAITNYRDFNNPKEGERSRGEIIPKVLTDEADIKHSLVELIRKSDHYSGFNLLAGTTKELYYANNIDGDLKRIKPGVHGLSNAFLDTPWPKVQTAKSEFMKAIDSAIPDKEAIFRMLHHSDTYPQETLPNTGLDPEMEKAVSPIFIETDGYGTRCSTLLTMHKSGRVHFIEKTYPISNEETDTDLLREFSFETHSNSA